MVETPRLPGEEWGSEVDEADEPELCRPFSFQGYGWLEGRTYPGLTPWALLSRRFAAQDSKSTEGAKQKSPGREPWEQMRSVKKP